MRWTDKVVLIRRDIQAVGYFGSYARGDLGVGSDLDLVLVLACPNNAADNAAATSNTDAAATSNTDAAATNNTDNAATNDTDNAATNDTDNPGDALAGLPDRHAGSVFPDRNYDFLDLRASLLDLPVPVDLLVYTTAEWQALTTTSTRFAQMLAKEVIWVFRRHHTSGQ